MPLTSDLSMQDLLQSRDIDEQLIRMTVETLHIPAQGGDSLLQVVGHMDFRVGAGGGWPTDKPQVGIIKALDPWLQMRLLSKIRERQVFGLT